MRGRATGWIRIVSAALALGACAEDPQTTSGLPRDTPQQQFGPIQSLETVGRQLDGVWRSREYGYVVEVSSAGAVAWDATDDACVKVAEAPGLVEFYDDFALAEGADEIRFYSATEPFGYPFQRIAETPAQCRSPTPDTVTGNFEAFASYFANHYAFFDLYDVDWSARIEQARPMLMDEMDDRALFDLMRQTLSGISDAHVEIEAEIDGERAHYEGDQGATRNRLIAQARQAGTPEREAIRNFNRGYWSDVTDVILGGKGVAMAQDRIAYGMASEKVGYIAFLTTGIYTEDGAESDDLDVLNVAMDKALALFEAKGAKAVIVDLSQNFGGHDFISRAIAGRFTDVRTPVYTKRPYDWPATRAEALAIEPAAGRRFTQPVFVLTSDVTVSGGEILTLAMRALPNVTHIGETTRGAFSDKLVKTLPNGWEVSLSNEIYADTDGVVWEGLGLPPDQEITVFDTADPLAGHRAAVAESVMMADIASK